MGALRNRSQQLRLRLDQTTNSAVHSSAAAASSLSPSSHHLASPPSSLAFLSESASAPSVLSAMRRGSAATHPSGGGLLFDSDVTSHSQGYPVPSEPQFSSLALARSKSAPSSSSIRVAVPVKGTVKRMAVAEGNRGTVHAVAPAAVTQVNTTASAAASASSVVAAPAATGMASNSSAAAPPRRTPRRRKRKSSRRTRKNTH
jgi:hypothetical protein